MIILSPSFTVQMPLGKAPVCQGSVWDPRATQTLNKPEFYSRQMYRGSGSLTVRCRIRFTGTSTPIISCLVSLSLQSFLLSLPTGVDLKWKHDCDSFL